MTARHCATCTCESAAEAKRRLELEAQRIERERREREFVRARSVLTEADLEWARQRLAKAAQS